jgi:hypothetical protein
MPAKAIDVHDTALQPHFLITGDKTVKADAKRKYLAYGQRPDRNSSVVPLPMALTKVKSTSAFGLSAYTQRLLKSCIVCTSTKDIMPSSGPVAKQYQEARQYFCRLARPIKTKALQQVNKNFPPPEGHRWKEDLLERFYLLLCPECASKSPQQLEELLEQEASPVTAVVPVTPVQTSGVSSINLTSFVFVTMAEDRQWDFKIEDLPQETMARIATMSMTENQQAAFTEYQERWHLKWDLLVEVQRQTERIFSRSSGASQDGRRHDQPLGGHQHRRSRRHSPRCVGRCATGAHQRRHRRGLRRRQCQEGLADGRAGR